MQVIHWNYFFAIEDDLATRSRYIEFHPDNFATYSIENARILMAAVQEVDVLLKAICEHYGAPGANVRDYYSLMAAKGGPRGLQLRASPTQPLSGIPGQPQDPGRMERWRKPLEPCLGRGKVVPIRGL